VKKLSLAALVVVLMLTPAVWGAHGKPDDSSVTKLVDSGSFGIFKSGHRVATESFTVRQGPEMSLISSQIKTEDGGASMSESSELELAPNGDLRRYLWKELTPGRSQLVLEPGEQILTEHISLSGTEKAHDVPFVLPISTMVLDDYFFVHREILAWKYIATSCVQPAKGECLLVKSSLGVIIPRQQTSGSVAMEYKGIEKVMIRGSEKQLRRFSLRSEDEDWALWLNDENKLVKISIAGDETEVVRD
jgi:hypothetical protein